MHSLRSCLYAAAAYGHRRLLAAAALFLSMTTSMVSPGTAATITIAPDGSGDFPTIQAAVAGAFTHDVIELLPGTYTGAGNRAIDLLGKGITIASQTGDPNSCIIDCEGASLGIQMISGEVHDSIIRGLTIRNGLGVEAGGIYLDGTSPTIEDCRFVGNAGSTLYAAGGVNVYLGYPVIRGCYFEGNDSDLGAGGIMVQGSTGTEISDCAFVGNTGGSGPLASSAAVWVDDGVASVSRCLFFDNHEGSAGALVVTSSNVTLAESTVAADQGRSVLVIQSHLAIENSIIAFGAGDAVACPGPGSTVLASCTDIFGNATNWDGCLVGQLGTNGNIEADPLFCDPVNDWTLYAASLCAATNSGGCGQIGAFGVGCDSTPTTPLSWGRLKSQYAEEPADPEEY